MPLRKRYESDHLLVRRVCGSRVAHVVSENVGTCLQCERCVMVSDTVASDTGADAQCNGHCKGTRRLKKTRSRRTLRTVTQHSQGGQTWLCPPCSSLHLQLSLSISSEIHERRGGSTFVRGAVVAVANRVWCEAARTRRAYSEPWTGECPCGTRWVVACSSHWGRAPLVWLSATPEEPTSSHCPLFWGVNTTQNRGQKNWRRRDVVDAPGELVSVRSLRP